MPDDVPDARVLPDLRVAPGGALVYRSDGHEHGAIVGQFDAEAGLLTVNLGWLRLAGLRIVVEDDPARDRHRNGVILER